LAAGHGIIAQVGGTMPSANCDIQGDNLLSSCLVNFSNIFDAIFTSISNKEFDASPKKNKARLVLILKDFRTVYVRE